MSRALRPDELKKMKGEVDAGARKAAREKLGGMIPFEPSPGNGQPEASIHLPNKNRAKLRPHGDVDIDISATGPTKGPVDVAGITGLPANPDGSVTVDPRDVIDTLGKIGGVDLDKDKAADTIRRRIGGARTGTDIPFSP